MMDVEFFKSQWQKAVEKSIYLSSCNSARTTNAEKIANFWDDKSAKYDDSCAQDHRRVEKVLDILHNENYIDKESSVLEIASGTGIYTIPISKCVKDVVTIDISKKMIEVLNEKANKAGAKNIAPLNENWNELNLKEKGLYKKFDLVLSALNPSIKDFDALNKMNEASKGACCLVSWAGPVEDKVASDLSSIILDEKDSKKLQRRAFDIIYSFSILYLMGYFPKIDYVDFGYTIEESYDEAVDRLCKKYSAYVDENVQVKDKITKYIEENIVDGVFRESLKSKIGIITWQVKNI